ncbi:hypothetical protein SPFL3102_02874 [Sporomusaceae bacterium FL31]|nr:hypothetical protein SPFL3101_01204 [Sporomusaceae bacterium FL31]GCE35046.1 hypothetical protein SPFL3102_02874 [Sporomusaceae bacterium]
MLSFFPTPYPDELMYSVFARYRVHSFIMSPKHTMNSLFMKKTVSAVLDLPANIDILCSNLPPLAAFTSANFIKNNTLYPLYAPFVTKKQAELVYKAMLSENGGSIHTRMGIMASSIKLPNFLRFCPICRIEDIQKYGETYWHRLHQIPGVLVCPHHKVILQDSLILTSKSNKQTFHAATEDVCPLTPRAVGFSNNTLEKLITIADDVKWLIDSNLSARGLDFYYEAYRDILINKGLASPKGKVFQEELTKDFLAFYGTEFLEAIQSQDVLSSDCWLKRLIRKPRCSNHPIRNLILIRYLTGSVIHFFSSKFGYTPFGDGPWPCLNAAATHYRKNVVNKLTITFCRHTKRPVGTFYCSCGFIYSRRGPDEWPESRYCIGRIKEFGPIWLSKLQELNQTKDSFRQIARCLKVDVGTVIKYLNSKSEKISENDEKALSDHRKFRNEWNVVISNNPLLSKTQLRNLFPGTYQWLYRHDKIWLDTNSPIKKQMNSKKNRVDWLKRDIEFLNIVQHISKDILGEEGKPIRRTVGRILVKAGIPWLQSNLVKTPQTKAYIERIIETSEQFHTRKIIWAIRELAKSGEELKEWRISKLANLRKDIVLEVIKKNMDLCIYQAFLSEYDYTLKKPVILK